MDRRITIGGILVLVVLGGYIWYSFLRADAPVQTPPTTPPATPIAFLTLPMDKVQTIQVTNVTSNTVTTVVRAGDSWTMQAPKQGEAASVPVQNFIFALSNIIAQRKFDTPGDLTQFGLNPAQYEAKFTLTDGSDITLLVGKKNPDATSYYVMKNGDGAVYLIVSATGDAISKFVTEPPYTPTPTATEPPPATEGPTPAAPETPAATPTP